MAINYKKKTLKIIILIALIIVFFLTSGIILNAGVNITNIIEYIKSFENYASAAILLFTIITASLGLPMVLPVIISAIILDPISAIAISAIGLTIGASIFSFIVRSLARNYIEKKFVDKLPKLKDFDEGLKINGFVTVLLLRMILPIPFELINIIGGLSKINFKDYVLATLIGITPGIIVMVYFIKSLGSIWSLQFFLASSAITVFSLLPFLSTRIRRFMFHL